MFIIRHGFGISRAITTLFLLLDRCYSIILAQPNIWETLDLNDVQDIIGRRLSDFDIRGFLLYALMR